jgi:hypothetical protein
MNYYLIKGINFDYGFISTELDAVELKDALKEFGGGSDFYDFDLESFASFVYDKYKEDVNVIPYDEVQFWRD